MSSKRIRKYQKIYIFGYVVFLLVFIGVIITLALIGISAELRTSIIFIVLVLVLIGSFLFRAKIYDLNNLYYYFKLLDNPGEPVSYSQDVLSDKWLQDIITSQNFILHENKKHYYFLYRIISDPVVEKQKRFKMIEILVIHKDMHNHFYLDEITETINNLEKDLQKKERFNRYIILQFKQIKEFDKKTQEQLTEVVVMKRNHSYYITINVGIQKDLKIACFLYNNDYDVFPYYSYGVERIISFTQ